MTENALANQSNEASRTESEVLAQKIVGYAWDTKALGVNVMDVRGLISYSDFIVICSGTSDRHVKAISSGIEKSLRDEGIRPLGTEGRTGGRWVLMDFNDVVIHVFVEEERDVYALDRLWSDAPKLKINTPPGLERPDY
jgi:ribosome-associated protein